LRSLFLIRHRSLYTYIYIYLFVPACVFAGKRDLSLVTCYFSQSGFYQCSVLLFLYVTCNLSHIVAVTSTCCPVNAHIRYCCSNYRLIARNCDAGTTFASMNWVTVTSSFPKLEYWKIYNYSDRFVIQLHISPSLGCNHHHLCPLWLHTFCIIQFATSGLRWERWKHALIPFPQQSCDAEKQLLHTWNE
jgi:hypothetical protein